METKWLEDFLLLLETRNFSKAAERRHITQPAFSRRIRALEEWLGVRLVDRSRKPLEFTPSALAYQAEIRNLLSTTYRLRSHMVAEDDRANHMFIASQHTLATAFLPKLIRRMESAGLNNTYRLQSGNKSDCVTLLMQGHVMFLLCYESVARPERLSSVVNRAVMGRDRMRLVSAASAGAALHDLTPERPLPMLSYPQDSFFGQLLWNERLPQLMRDTDIEIVCETAFALSLRELVLGGAGVAWLPEILIHSQLSSGTLVALDHIADACELDIVVYAHRHAANSTTRRIWEFFEDCDE